MRYVTTLLDRRQKPVTRRLLVAVAAACLTLTPEWTSAQGSTATRDIEGLWFAMKRFGPEAQGELLVHRRGDAWRAALAGRSAGVRMTVDSVAFELPGAGRFRGRLAAGRAIAGTWTQQPTNVATPLSLAPCGADCFRGTVTVLPDELSFFLKVTRRPDGSLNAFLRNPERNFGTINTRVARMEVSGQDVRLLDRRDTTVLQGVLRNGLLSVFIPLRGGATYDFRRIDDSATTHFYPSGRPGASYAYRAPQPRDDGWPVSTLGDVNIAVDSITRAIARINAVQNDSASVWQPHALLIARHGKLVLEEYFHGEHAEKPHNTRSASKSFLTTLIGAAMYRGVRISPETPVYATLRPGAAMNARQQAMTLGDLLTMSAGLDCNDSGEQRPGNEDVLTNDQSRPDWYSVILNLDVVRDAGVPAIYCSIKPHLAGAVLARAARRPLDELMRDLLLVPLGMKSYYMALSPLGDVYFGGGHSMRARDFLKLGQLYLNGGTWAGKRLMSRDWVARSIEPRFTIGRASYLNYGYLWWSREYSHFGRQVRAYMALGNGGQVVMFIPDLDLVVATNGGNYSDNPKVFYYTDEFIPRVVLPAVLPDRK
jgi:CubicO group peptidase (beta-lactamase class C family)